MWYHLLQVSQATHPCFALLRLLPFSLNFLHSLHMLSFWLVMVSVVNYQKKNIDSGMVYKLDLVNK